MQSTKLSASYLLACVLPLFLFTWFAEPYASQMDFWLAWLVAMLLVSLPVLFAEIGLARRSGQSPLLAMPVLTRESDSSMAWRGYGWLAQLTALSLAALVIASIGVHGQALFAMVGVVLPTFVVGALLMAVVLIISTLGFGLIKPMLLLALLAVLATIGIHLADGFELTNIQMTAFSLAEWARAVALALLCFAVGGGVYWWELSQTNLNQTNLNQAQPNQVNQSVQSQSSASRQVLPILAVQVVVGLVAMVLVASKEATLSMTLMLMSTDTTLVQDAKMGSTLASGLLVMAGVSLAIALVSMTMIQVKERLGLVKSMLMLLPALVLVVLPVYVLWGLTVMLSIISVLVLSVFVGWQMKISHLRKSLNFSSEINYNLWRVAIRIFVPLALLVAMVGWVQIWLG